MDGASEPVGGSSPGPPWRPASALPLWAGLAGYAAFAGLYEPVYAESPTTFLADAPVSLVTVLFSLGVGALAAIGGELAGSAVTDPDGRHVRAGEVA